MLSCEPFSPVVFKWKLIHVLNSNQQLKGFIESTPETLRRPL